MPDAEAEREQGQDSSPATHMAIAHSRDADQNSCWRYQSSHALCPLRLLQDRQQLTKFSRTVRPPWTLGMTWSRVGDRPSASSQ